MPLFLGQIDVAYALLAVVSLASACGCLSVIVVLRRWAFIGEGIGHSGYGGAGLAWLLALVFPSLDTPWFPYVGVIVFCTLTALMIGRLSRDSRIAIDSAIGVFLVAWLAIGFLSQQIYYHQKGAMPFLWDTILFGRMSGMTREFAIACAAVAGLVIFVLGILQKEILAYCFDPLTAKTSGVRTRLIHDLLMILLTLVIVIGTRVVGSVLVTALLILPGATGLVLSRRLWTVLLISSAASILGAVAGITLSQRWMFVPVGPAIVLTLCILFLAAIATSKTQFLGR